MIIGIGIYLKSKLPHSKELVTQVLATEVVKHVPVFLPSCFSSSLFLLVESQVKCPELTIHDFGSVEKRVVMAVEEEEPISEGIYHEN